MRCSCCGKAFCQGRATAARPDRSALHVSIPLTGYTPQPARRGPLAARGGIAGGSTCSAWRFVQNVRWPRFARLGHAGHDAPRGKAGEGTSRSRVCASAMQSIEPVNRAGQRSTPAISRPQKGCSTWNIRCVGEVKRACRIEQGRRGWTGNTGQERCREPLSLDENGSGHLAASPNYQSNPRPASCARTAGRSQRARPPSALPTARCDRLGLQASATT